MMCDFFQIGSGISYYVSAINSDKLTEEQVWNSVSNLFAVIDLSSINLNNNKISFINGLCSIASAQELKRLTCVEKNYISPHKNSEEHLNLVIIIYQAIIKKFDDEISQCDSDELSKLLSEKNIFTSNHYKPIIIKKRKNDLSNDLMTGKISKRDYYIKMQSLLDLESLYIINGELYTELCYEGDNSLKILQLCAKFCEIIKKIKIRKLNESFDCGQINYSEWFDNIGSINQDNDDIAFPFVYAISSAPTRQ